MAKVVAISNQKGGVGKTTTAGALIAGLANKGYRVLGIDFDPQGNLSDSFRAESYESPTIYEVLKGEVSAQEAIQKIGNFDFIPANIMLAGAEQEIVSQAGKEHRLKESIEAIVENYDFIILDTPPSLGVLTSNAFTACEEILLPTTPSIFALKGITQLNITIKNIKKYCNPNVRIGGILITKFDKRTNIGKEIKEMTEEFSEHFKTKVFDTYIRSAVAVEEAQAKGIDIFSYSENATVSEDYKNFVEEYLKGDK